MDTIEICRIAVENHQASCCLLSAVGRGLAQLTGVSIFKYIRSHREVQIWQKSFGS
jgi:hypothetical protein